MLIMQVIYLFFYFKKISHHTSYIIHHISHITYHTSHIPHHTSHITHHTSHITHQLSYIIVVCLLMTKWMELLKLHRPLHPLQTYIDTALAYTENYQKLLCGLLVPISTITVAQRTEWQAMWDNSISGFSLSSFTSIATSILFSIKYSTIFKINSNSEWTKETTQMLTKTKEAPKDDNKITTWKDEISEMLKYILLTNLTLSLLLPNPSHSHSFPSSLFSLPAHSLILLLTPYSLIHSFTHSLIHSLLIHFLTLTLTHSLLSLLSLLFLFSLLSFLSSLFFLSSLSFLFFLISNNIL